MCRQLSIPSMCLSLFVIHKWLLCLIRLLIQFWFSSHPSPSTVREILANSQRVSFYGFLMAMTKSEEINQDIGESDNITCCIILLVYCHKSYCFRVVIIGCWVSCLSKQCSNRVVCIQFLFKLYLFYPLIWFSNFLFVFVFSFEEKSLKKIIYIQYIYGNCGLYGYSLTGALPNKSELLIDPEMDLELERLWVDRTQMVLR